MSVYGNVGRKISVIIERAMHVVASLLYPRSPARSAGLLP